MQTDQYQIMIRDYEEAERVMKREVDFIKLRHTENEEEMVVLLE